MTDPGKYDAVAKLVRITTGADAVMVAVLGGSNGSGFSFHGPNDDLAKMPQILRDIAAEMEADLARMQSGEQSLTT